MMLATENIQKSIVASYEILTRTVKDASRWHCDDLPESLMFSGLHNNLFFATVLVQLSITGWIQTFDQSGRFSYTYAHYGVNSRKH